MFSQKKKTGSTNNFVSHTPVAAHYLTDMRRVLQNKVKHILYLLCTCKIYNLFIIENQIINNDVLCSISQKKYISVNTIE